MGLLVDRKGFAAASTAGDPYLLEGIETGITAVGICAGGKVTAEGAQGGVYGIKECSADISNEHLMFYAN